MEVFRYAKVGGGGNPLLGGGGGGGGQALMGITPNVFWFCVAAACVFIVLHALVLAVTKPKAGQAH